MSAPHSTAERVCARLGCGQRFTPKRADARYCSASCRAQASAVSRKRNETKLEVADKPRSDTDSRSATGADVALTWEPVIERNSYYDDIDEPCPDCGTLLWATARRTRRRCNQCKGAFVPPAVTATYAPGSQRHSPSPRDLDREALKLAGRKGIMLGELRRMIDAGLDDESATQAEWFIDEVKSAASGGRLDALAELFIEAVLRARPAPVLAAGYYDDDDEDEDEGYRPPRPAPRLMLAPPPPAEPDWEWALRRRGWDVITPPRGTSGCHVTRAGARCDNQAMHNIGDRSGVQVYVCATCAETIAKTITTENRRQA